MPDPTYQPKIYRKSGGDELVVASGGKITQEAGGSVVQPVIAKAANFNAAAGESGAVYVIGATDVVATLPATQAGLRYRFCVSAVSAVTGLAISPQAADKIMGNGFTSADNKDAINTAATDREGDMIEVIGDGIDGWYVTNIIGTWAREA